jgi:FkbM family methyltransferase
MQAEILKLNNVHTIFDLGANIGFATLVFAEIFPHAKIIAIEMEAQNFEMLQLNCKSLMASKRLQPVQGVFYPKKNVNLAMERGRLGDWHYTVHEVEFDSTPMDIYTTADLIEMNEGSLPDLIKMDIEGAESTFLADVAWCQKVIAKSNLLVELHHFTAFDLFFHQLRKNRVTNAKKIGEYWLVNKIIDLE